MLSLAKLVHDAIGIENPRLFILGCSIVGCILGCGLGWLLVKAGQRPEVPEGPSVIQATPSQAPGPETVVSPTDLPEMKEKKETRKVAGEEVPKIDRSVTIGSNTTVNNSPIVTGDKNVILSGPESRIQSLGLRIAIDIPTSSQLVTKPGDPSMSMGFGSSIALWDSQKKSISVYKPRF